MRREILLNDKWTFTKPGEAPVCVNVPHTWNNIDGADGGNDYWRGTCVYEKDFAAPAFDPGTEQVWLQFDGVNATADVSLNGQKVVHHDGGYSTFRADITDLLWAGQNGTGGEARTSGDASFEGACPEGTFSSGKDFSSGEGASTSERACSEGAFSSGEDDSSGAQTPASTQKQPKRVNHLTVQVDNSVNDHVYPQKADFTFYGGIYRNVTLLVVPRTHIALGHLGDRGVKITPQVDEYDHSTATIRVETAVEGPADNRFSKDTANSTAAASADTTDIHGLAGFAGSIASADPVNTDEAAVHVLVSLYSKEGQLLAQQEGRDVTFSLTQPHLWDGVADPYLYTVKVQLVFGQKDGMSAVFTTEDGPVTASSAEALVLDEVVQRCGVRAFHIDAKDGFCLNGRPYRLHGVARHQDRKGLGNAITDEMHDEDMALIREVGANAIRLAHYQHAQHFYDLCDEYGMVVWAEIPYISEHLPFGRNNTISQMRELIAQNYNHASICVWGISNEITISTKDRKDMLDNHAVLNDLVHEMDPSRPTSLACYAMCGPFNKVAHITDAVGWNLYLGWYVPGFFLNDLWVDFFHLVYPKRPLAFSEYGAEGMPNIHSARPRRGDQSEEYQAIYHEYMLRFFDRHPWMWGSFVWNMFDFAADARDQGGEPGMNHKGLITYDRKTRKDSFYLYKAWWSDEPFVHICGKRFTNHTEEAVKIKVYSNQPAVTLYVDGKKFATQGAAQSQAAQQTDSAAQVQPPEPSPARTKGADNDQRPDSQRIFCFTVPFSSTQEGGQLHIQAVAGEQGQLHDCADFRHVSAEDPSYKVKKSGQKSNWT